MSDRSLPPAAKGAESEFMKALNDALSTEQPEPPRASKTPDATVTPKVQAPEVQKPAAAPRPPNDLRVPPVIPVEIRPLPPLPNVGRNQNTDAKPTNPAEINAPLDLRPKWMTQPSDAPAVAPKPAPMVAPESPSAPAPKEVQAPVAPAAPLPIPDLVLNDDLPSGYGDSYTPSAVIVDKTHHLTYVLQVHNGELENVLTIDNAVGADNMSPNERMVVAFMDWDHPWTPPKSIDPEQKKRPPWSQSNGTNPLGEGYIGLKRSFGLPDDGSYGLHGTSDPTSIGKSVSHGCVRHQNADLERLWPLVHRGTPVYFVYDIHGAKVFSKDFEQKR